MESYLKIVSHYEKCLDTYGDSHLGVDWPSQSDVNKRYFAMLDIYRFDINAIKKIPQILDFGCGAAHLYEFMQLNGFEKWQYKGLDISQKFIDLCKSKYPSLDFKCIDFLKEDPFFEKSDYVILNGVFTEKRDLSFEEMFEFFSKMITKVFRFSNRGIAFNVMSKNVDWERDDLFHVPIDLLTSFLTKNLSRNFIVRNDYGLFEYTVYVYH